MKIFKSLRLEQWTKNFVIFFPYILIGFNELDIFIDLIGIFFGFSLVVSSTYIINDLVDIESDKLHPTKKLRPVASGYLSKKYWTIMSLILFCLGTIIVYIVKIQALIPLLIYVSLTLLYSFKFKFIKYADILLVSILFVLRLFIGGIGSSVNVSFYLIFFVFFKSLEIITSKKLSILLNTKIVNSEVKSFLLKNYTKNKLMLITNLSSIISLIIYLLWIIIIKVPFVQTINAFYLMISFAMLASFDYLFLKYTNNIKTEDIFKLVKSNKVIFFNLIFFGIFALLGVL